MYQYINLRKATTSVLFSTTSVLWISFVDLNPEGVFTDDLLLIKPSLELFTIAHLFGFLTNTWFFEHLVFFHRTEMRFCVLSDFSHISALKSPNHVPSTVSIRPLLPYREDPAVRTNRVAVGRREGRTPGRPGDRAGSPRCSWDRRGWCPPPRVGIENPPKKPTQKNPT